MPRQLAAALVVVLAATLAMCASAKRYTVDDLPAERLTFRWGGGFTGQTKEYVLLPNGQLFARRSVLSELPLREYEPLDKRVAEDLFDTYEELGFGELGYDDPGNMTYTVALATATDSTAITWGGSRVQPSEAVRTYWRRATAALGDSEPLAGAESASPDR